MKTCESRAFVWDKETVTEVCSFGYISQGGQVEESIRYQQRMREGKGTTGHWPQHHRCSYVRRNTCPSEKAGEPRVISFTGFVVRTLKSRFAEMTRVWPP